MKAKSGSPAGLSQGLFESSRNLHKSSLAPSRKAIASMLYGQQCCLLMLMTCMLSRVAVLQHCFALQGGCKQPDALGQCTVTLYVSEVAAALLQPVAEL